MWMSQEPPIIYEHGADGWWLATIPEVPGAFSQGQTKAEARENVLDALQELMAARRELALRDKSGPVETERLSLPSKAR
jgi:predicted RNase H-like HicB family nuclease